MGFFDALFGGKSAQKGNKVEVVPDHIWMTRAAKFAGLAQDLEERSKSPAVAILLVAHFPDELASLEELANRQNGTVPCRAVSASSLDGKIASDLNLDDSAVIDMLIGERHPLPSVDDQLKEFADRLPCRCRLSYHVSLEDAVMKVFAGEQVQGILQSLGMAENEAIESPLVSRQIRRAQQKIEGRTLRTEHAESAAAWLAANCPELVGS